MTETKNKLGRPARKGWWDGIQPISPPPLMTPDDADLFWELQSERQHRRYGWLLRLYDLKQRFMANQAVLAGMTKESPSEPYFDAENELHALHDEQGRLFNEVWGTLMGEQPDLVSSFVEDIIFQRENPKALQDPWWEK